MDDLSIMQRVGLLLTELDKLPEYYQYLLYVAGNCQLWHPWC